jgi:hypothetical protein
MTQKPVSHNGSTFFLHEPLTKYLNKKQKELCSLARVPSVRTNYKVNGSVTCDGYIELDSGHVTEDMARDCGLTLEGLCTAIEKGYKFAWKLVDPHPFKSGPLVSSVSASGSAAQTWTDMAIKPALYLPEF